MALSLTKKQGRSKNQRIWQGNVLEKSQQPSYRRAQASD